MSRLVRALLALTLFCGVFTLGMIFAIVALADYAEAGAAYYEAQKACEEAYQVPCKAQMVPE